jgi:CheY-like chemotaxis protein
MPELDGFGLVHRLRINPETRDIPVVFITATYVTPEDKDFALSIGATRFIQKPVDIENFLMIIAELLQLGTPAPSKHLNDFNFYDGYRIRLEAKLDSKIKQIAREEHLLSAHPDTVDQDLQVSLRHAVRERDELKILLDQIHKQLEKIAGQNKVDSK